MTDLDDYHEHLEFALKVYLRKPGIDKNSACLQGIDFFLSILKNQAKENKFSNLTSTTIGKPDLEATFSDRVTSGMEMFDESVEIDKTNAPLKKIKKTSIEMLKEYKASTRKDFESLLIELELTNPAMTNVGEEIKVLRAHLFSASLAGRFSTVKRKNAATDESLAEKVLGLIDHIPKSASPEEQKCLNFLRSGTKLQFVHNSMTYYNEKYCGTPDAVVLHGNKVVQVAEFKTDLQKSQAISQLSVYLELFKLKKGYVVLTSATGIETIDVELTDTVISKLESRYQRYSQLKEATD